ncbi:MAG: hypothetical protein ACP5OG_00695 [Candidatus Nanoarchaeia archaeon]
MIKSLDLIVNGSNIENLPTEEQIKNGYQHPAPGNNHPRLFAWQFLYTDYLVEAAKHWQDQVLVDIGCGIRLDGYIISKISGAKAYVAVEPYNISKFYQRLVSIKEKNGDEDINEKIKRVQEFIQNKGYDNKVVEKINSNIDAHFEGKQIPLALVAEDMVSALQRLPDNSVSIMAAGLDNCIIWSDEYSQLAEKEIARVLHLKGAYLAMCSRLKPKELILDSSFEGNDFRKFTKK